MSTVRRANRLTQTRAAGAHAARGFVAAFSLLAAASLGACKNDDHPPISGLPVAAPGSGGTPADAGRAVDAGASSSALFTTPTPPRAIAVDSASVFVSFAPGTASDGGADEGRILVAPRAGGAAPTTLITGGSPSELLRVGASLVWIDQGGATATGAVFAVDLGTAGATPRRLLSSLEAPSAIVSDGTFVYVASRGTSLGVTIDRVALAGGQIQNVASMLGGDVAPAGIALDARNVYFVGVGQVGGSLYRAPIVGGGAETLWTTPTSVPGDVVLSVERAYVTLEASGNTSSIAAVAIGGGAPSTFAGSLGHPARLAIDGTEIYWTNQDAAAGAVLHAPLATGETKVLATGLDSPHAIAIADGVYVTANAPNGKGAVYKFSK